MDEIYIFVDEIYSIGVIQRLTSNANSATVIGSILASSTDTVESEGAADEAVLNKVL
jgi:hypothetical protein